MSFTITLKIKANDNIKSEPQALLLAEGMKKELLDIDGSADSSYICDISVEVSNEKNND